MAKQRRWNNPPDLHRMGARGIIGSGALDRSAIPTHTVSQNYSFCLILRSLVFAYISVSKLLRTIILIFIDFTNQLFITNGC